MTNKPMLSVDRDLIERAVQAIINTSQMQPALNELRAILDKPGDVLPCDVKVAPGTIIRKGCKVSVLMACIGARSGLDDKFTQLIEPAAQHQGEQVAWVIGTADGNGADYYPGKGLDTLEIGAKLYAEQPAPVAVVMPERMVDTRNDSRDDRIYDNGWNACLEEVARLNGVKL